MTKIMFVCHGNICRSPMAEFILKDMVQKQGVADRFLIASCATSAEEIWGEQGNPVYPPAKTVGYTNRPGDVSDPWYSKRFDVAYADIFEGCECMLKAL